MANDIDEMGAHHACETPWEDLRRMALEAYEEASCVAHSWSSVIPRAINYYFDNAKPAAAAPVPLATEPELTRGWARIRAANGDTHEVTFACSACKRALIWSFEDWKCPCGNASFTIQNAFKIDATSAPQGAAMSLTKAFMLETFGEASKSDDQDARMEKYGVAFAAIQYALRATPEPDRLRAGSLKDDPDRDWR